MNIFHYGVYIFYVLLHRIGIVKSQITCTSELFGNSEIHTDRFRMPYMQITVRLWRKTRIQSATILSGFQIGFNYLFYEIKTFLVFYLIVSFNLCHKCALFISAQIYEKLREGQNERVFFIPTPTVHFTFPMYETSIQKNGNDMATYKKSEITIVLHQIQFISV